MGILLRFAVLAALWVLYPHRYAASSVVQRKNSPAVSKRSEPKYHPILNFEGMVKPPNRRSSSWKGPGNRDRERLDDRIRPQRLLHCLTAQRWLSCDRSCAAVSGSAQTSS